jgi:hypothetical protein
MLAAILEQARVKQGLPPGPSPNDFGLPMTGLQMLCIKIDHLLTRFWFILLSLVLILCFVVAARWPGLRRAAHTSAASSDNS